MSQGNLRFQPMITTSLKAGFGLIAGTVIAWGQFLGGGAAQTLPEGNPETGNAQPTAANSETVNQRRFDCQWSQGQYTVMYNPQSYPNQSFPWAAPQAMGGGWSPERRCNEISRRLEEYRPQGLVEMKTSTENGYNIVCVTTEANSACQIVFTVPPGQDPVLTRDRVFENLATADRGEQTQAVNTYTGSGDDLLGQLVGAGLSIITGNPAKAPTTRDSISLKPFLDQADGGTGEFLHGGVPRRAPGRLNPGQFR